jgi:hypothetical protein
MTSPVLLANPLAIRGVDVPAAAIVAAEDLETVRAFADLRFAVLVGHVVAHRARLKVVRVVASGDEATYAGFRGLGNAVGASKVVFDPLLAVLDQGSARRAVSGGPGTHPRSVEPLKRA